jgi:PAS domain-containing protein
MEKKLNHSSSVATDWSGERITGPGGLQENDGRTNSPGTLREDRTDASVPECLSTMKRLGPGLEMAELGTWEWNIATGKITLNRKGAQILGYSKDEIESDGLWWDHLVHPHDRHRVRLELEAHIQGATPF